jgi:ElaB/YqjD/DUF883 family membrane-anchored ribosome-binding protein
MDFVAQHALDTVSHGTEQSTQQPIIESENMKNDFSQATANLKINSERIADEIGDVVSDAKHLLQSYGAEKLDGAKHSFESAQAAVSNSAKQYASTANSYIHDNPWQAIAIAAAAGLAVGFLVTRR